MGVEDSMKGLIDLVERKAFVFEGPSGDTVVGALKEGGLRCLAGLWTLSCVCEDVV